MTNFYIIIYFAHCDPHFDSGMSARGWNRGGGAAWKIRGGAQAELFLY